MNKLNVSKRAGVLFVFFAAAAIVTPAQTFTTLHSFGGMDGEAPYAGLVQGTDGNFYGTTRGGGVNGGGTVFSITPTGTLTNLHSFDGTDGERPTAELVQGTDGRFYGTTSEGVNPYDGTVFSITTSGTLTTLHGFDRKDGASPYAGLVQGTNGKFYGTTEGGGGHGNCGTVFSIKGDGTLTTLHSFTGDPADGCVPYAGLVQAITGKFFGTTSDGGANTNVGCPTGCGTIFKTTPKGTLTTLYSLRPRDGSHPMGALVQGTDGNFYGTTYGDGANHAGTVFRITPSGELTKLYDFCSQSDCPDGAEPRAGMVQGTDGNFYGTTGNTIFSITPSGTLTTLHIFCSQTNCADGEYAYAGLVQGTDGNFYGTTGAGGANAACTYFAGCGTIFSLSVGLAPFVEANPVSGAVGAAVTILGTNLTGATSVTFNGTGTTFTVKSSSEITTSVPTGATSGTVQVVTPGGTLSSNMPFQVLP